VLYLECRFEAGFLCQFDIEGVLEQEHVPKGNRGCKVLATDTTVTVPSGNRGCKILATVSTVTCS
jgi:hypothetical protein